MSGIILWILADFRNCKTLSASPDWSKEYDTGIEVAGYASSRGSTEVNQKLSEDRANNVTNILLQKGNVPLTRLLAPGAMGESRQVNIDKSVEGWSENRRVVVRVLRNKAIAGI